jgi:polar amino acid transport system permease protein
MATSAEAADLGPFAPEQGPRSLAAVAGAVCGVGSASIAFGAVLLDVAGVSQLNSRAVAMPLAALALASSVAGLYRVAVAGRRGRVLAAIGLAAALAGGITSFIHGAVVEGQLQLSEFGAAYFNGDVLGAIWGDLLRALRNTVRLAALSEALGIGIGLVIATFAISDRWWLRLPAVAYVDVIRGLPLLMLLILVFFGLTFVGVTLQPFTAAIVGLTVNSSAYVAEIFRAGIQSIERGQMDAARSLGMPHATAMLFVIIPQAVRRVIPPLTNEFIALVKDTSLVTILGTTVADRELLTAARQSAATTFSATPYMAASLLYLAVTLPLTRLVNVLERRLRRVDVPRWRLRLRRHDASAQAG